MVELDPVWTRPTSRQSREILSWCFLAPFVLPVLLRSNSYVLGSLNFHRSLCLYLVYRSDRLSFISRIDHLYLPGDTGHASPTRFAGYRFLRGRPGEVVFSDRLLRVSTSTTAFCQTPSPVTLHIPAPQSVSALSLPSVDRIPSPNPPWAQAANLLLAPSSNPRDTSTYLGALSPPPDRPLLANDGSSRRRRRPPRTPPTFPIDRPITRHGASGVS
ncbi:hypothetical protein VTK56DRAFT_597 [Thermocarpiscus australiensis]